MNRKNIIYAGRLFILLLIISYVLDKVIYYGINHIAKEVYSGQSVGKFNQYIGIKDSLDFIVYGNSRANHHINPSLITERGFNMGFDGQKIAFSATLLKLLPTKKQTLLFHIDPESAVDDDYMADDLSSLKVMYNKNEKVKKEIDRYKKLNPLQRFYWCISYNGIMFGIIKNYLSPNYEHTNYNGYDPLQVNRSQKTSQLGVNERNLNNNCEKRLLRLNPVYKSYLFDLREFCAINEKQIIFFTSPKFFDSCKSDNLFFKDEMRKMNLKYNDFSDMFINTTDLSNWKDATHLSEKGAEKFTSQIATTLFESKEK